MYEQRYRLHRKPFQLPAENEYFETAGHREMFSSVLHALKSDLGLAVLTGPTGSGKTTALEMLRHRLAADAQTVVLRGGTVRSVPDLLAALHRSLLKIGSAGKRATTLTGADAVRRWEIIDRLRQLSDFWGPVVVLLDDAHLVQSEVFVELRSLLEEDTDGRRLLRLLIAGPLSLEDVLARPDMADFAQKIRTYAFLQPLTSAESVLYLRQQLQTVGGNPSQLFEPAAVELIAAAADGLPRCINLLTDEAFVVGDERAESVITVSAVSAALKRLQHLPYPWNISADASDAAVPDPHSNDHRDRNLSDGVIEFGGSDTAAANGSADTDSDRRVPDRTISERGECGHADSDESIQSGSDFGGTGFIEIGAPAGTSVDSCSAAGFSNRDSQAVSEDGSADGSEAEELVEAESDGNIEVEFEAESVGAEGVPSGPTSAQPSAEQNRPRFLCSEADVDVVFDHLHDQLTAAGAPSDDELFPLIEDNWFETRTPLAELEIEADAAESDTTEPDAVEADVVETLVIETDAESVIVTPTFEDVAASLAEFPCWRPAGTWLSQRVTTGDRLADADTEQTVDVPDGWNSDFVESGRPEEPLSVLNELQTFAEPSECRYAAAVPAGSVAAIREKPNAVPVFDRFTWLELGRPVTPERIQRQRGPDRLAMTAVWPPDTTGVAPPDAVTVTQIEDNETIVAVRPDKTIEELQSLIAQSECSVEWECEGVVAEYPSADETHAAV
ncbi:MAG: AAA family ATPase, partial [Planctomycetaceae bacterium]|nr:AAA family ATPase [Planctomycetaceae bacterium]